MSGTVGVILTGGASSRMGADKATLPVHGKPMVVCVADALWEAGLHPVECQGGDVESIEEFGLRVVPDPEPGRGPLAAMHAALERNADRDVVIVACDLVDIEGHTIRALLDAATAEGRPDVAAAFADGQHHLASWWRAGTAGKLAALRAEGVDAYQAALARLVTLDVPVAEAAIRNVNTPSDLAAGR